MKNCNCFNWRGQQSQDSHSLPSAVPAKPGLPQPPSAVPVKPGLPQPPSAVSAKPGLPPQYSTITSSQPASSLPASPQCQKKFPATRNHHRGYLPLPSARRNSKPLGTITGAACLSPAPEAPSHQGPSQGLACHHWTFIGFILIGFMLWKSFTMTDRSV